ncbi:MAG: hypothetical protein J2O48_05445 [Solirubrobacterales bacterium]|nr:hypothetical protein [Solirubrobacterales bacterium]
MPLPRAISAGAGVTLGVAALSATPALAAKSAGPKLSLAHGCYRVGQKVTVSGSGFIASAPYDLTVDGVDFGQALTSGKGTLRSTFSPGGLPAGKVQVADSLTASDGDHAARASFTLTRPTGAAYGAGKGSSTRRKVPFVLWDFGAGAHAYVHYVSPGGQLRATAALGRLTGQCGALLSKPAQLFPFNPSAGRWTLQFDTQRGYQAKPRGPVARIRVKTG